MSTREEIMKPIDRRSVLWGVLRGAAIVGVSMALIPSATEAVPLATGHAGAANTDGFIEEAQWGPRRRRRWRCWWSRGRRRCGWRWW
jgi:hypothetical protein